MSNNIDPFYGHVTYFSKNQLDSFSNPMTSMDGMIADIKKDCQDIENLRFSNVSDREYRIEALLREIVRLYQAICYLRLHESIYINTRDRLFFGALIPLDENDLDEVVNSSEMREDLFNAVRNVASNSPPSAVELLGCNMGDIEEICELYQGILTLRRHRR